MKRPFQLLWRLAVLAPLFFFLVFRLVRDRPDVLESSVSLLVYPFVKLGHWFSGVGERYSNLVRGIDGLTARIKELEDEREKLLTQLAEAGEFRKLAKELGPVVDGAICRECRVIGPCQVIQKNLSSMGHAILIDRGSDDGVEKDMVAVVGKALLGRVSEVFPRFSRVLCLSDVGCKVSAECVKTGAVGIVETTAPGARDLCMSYISLVMQLDPGDIISSSGEGLVFPRGLLIGEVIDKTSDGISYTARVRPFLDPKEVSYCMIVQK